MPGAVVSMHVSLSQSGIIWHWPKAGDATDLY